MSFSTHSYLLITTDPVHIGTGGMRLGRVDNSIVREPGTRLPKIPGTSLSGVIRSYAAYRYGKRRCSGQGQPQEDREGHCCLPTCPICYTFGSVSSDRSYSGVVSIGDARLLLFPVYSMAGPVWVSTKDLLGNARFNLEFARDSSNISLTTMEWDKPLNLGWLMVEKPGRVTITPPNELKNKAEWKTVEKNIVLISDKLFSQIVNSNLEVRTSVAINPETGAAEDKALFTYEAIPRATFLWMDVVVDDYRETFPNPDQLKKWKEILEGENESAKKDLLRKWHLLKGSGDNNLFEACNWIEDAMAKWDAITIKNIDPKSPSGLLTAGLEWAEHLGVGGMGTRGFGRIRKIGEL